MPTRTNITLSPRHFSTPQTQRRTKRYRDHNNRVHAINERKGGRSELSPVLRPSGATAVSPSTFPSAGSAMAASPPQKQKRHGTRTPRGQPPPPGTENPTIGAASGAAREGCARRDCSERRGDGAQQQTSQDLKTQIGLRLGNVIRAAKYPNESCRARPRAGSPPGMGPACARPLPPRGPVPAPAPRCACRPTAAASLCLAVWRSRRRRTTSFVGSVLGPSYL